jgi:hypothetical protein
MRKAGRRSADHQGAQHDKVHDETYRVGFAAVAGEHRPLDQGHVHLGLADPSHHGHHRGHHQAAGQAGECGRPKFESRVVLL